MAKGQKRSNREVKKPKQVKAKAAPADTGLTARLTESQARAKGPKK
jgi:hypothetical protein